MKVLIVEDEDAIAGGLKFNFEAEGFEVTLAGDGPSAIKHFQHEEHPFDLIILDLMLPCMSGYEACREIRTTDKQVPILVLSARTLSEDKTMAFDCGIDQYMTKPFALPELLSRARNLLERHRVSTTQAKVERDAELSGMDVYRFGEIVVDFRRFRIAANEEIYDLTTIELQLLRYFIQHEGDVLSRSQIMEDVWGESADITSRSIDNFVMRLRKYIEPNPSAPQHLLSVRGTGYRFVAEPE